MGIVDGRFCREVSIRFRIGPKGFRMILGGMECTLMVDIVLPVLIFDRGCTFRTCAKVSRLSLLFAGEVGQSKGGRNGILAMMGSDYSRPHTVRDIDPSGFRGRDVVVVGISQHLSIVGHLGW